MKKIIEGKTYNTKTAEEVAGWTNGLGGSDFRNCEETLYKTKKGAWFICGSGGPMSDWSESNGNTTWGGDGILVLSESEALAWCESKDVDADVIEANFNIEEA